MTCWAVLAAAWVSTIAAWRRHRPHLRYWSGVYTFGVVVVGFVGIIMLLSGLWTRKKVDHEIAVTPAAATMSQNVLNSQRLRTAIANNDLASVESTLRTSDSVALLEGGGSEDFTLRPLDYAVEKGRLQIAAVLLDHGATIADDQRNPLIAAARRDDLPMLRLLLHHGARVNDVRMWNGGSPALWSAVTQGDAKAVDCLLKAGANSNTWDVRPIDYEARRSVLQLARSEHNTQIVKRLKQAGTTK